MATACQTVRFVADLTMHVPRNSAGTLDDGAESVVAGVDCVTSVEAVDVTDLRPRLNDLEIRATVTVAADVEDSANLEAAGRAALENGFGVECVEALRAERATPDAPDPAREYG